MPIYVFKCPECGNAEEIRVGVDYIMNDYSGFWCTKCPNWMLRVPSSFTFKIGDPRQFNGRTIGLGPISVGSTPTLGILLKKGDQIDNEIMELFG